MSISDLSSVTSLEFSKFSTHFSICLTSSPRSRTDSMASDLSRAGPVERDIEQAITALKKGACLLKYGRRGKPKFCQIRLSNDESALIWFSGKEEKHLKLSHISRIISGQRTPIFQRYPRPEKEYQSFSLIYSDRSLDLICKDKDEAEVWFSGLKALISRFHNQKRRTESRSDGFPSGASSPRTYTRRSSPLNSPFGSNESLQKDSGDHLRLHSPFESPPKNGLDKALSDVILYSVPPKGFFHPDSTSGSVLSVSSGGSDSLHGHMKAMGMDAFRVSLSSAVSSSSQGSGHDDGDAFGDVFIWGEGTGDGVLGGGTHNLAGKMDSLLPKALESAVVLDVHNIACGGRHAALVTKQGEIFSWGEELGGRLGHGVDSDVLHPKLIESLSNTNIELVACGEYHTCAVTLSGELYTWGDGTYNYGLLGHGNQVSHWVPKKVNGPLEGIHVSSISCGPWHTAVVTSAGQLFTFGDGTFGVLGHGDRKSVTIPREVESLKGLRTVRTACGVWHSAAVVEVMVGNSSSSNCSSGKLFTWGDGDKGRLGHGDKEAKLVPTCVAALVEPNFCHVVCGHSLTVALTTSGHVYTMGSPVYGQLGNLHTDGKLPKRVEGKLSKSFVEEIACGAYHVAVLTSRTEVYTWGKGANGRSGHGDIEDRNTPTLVEALKDKQVKSIACAVRSLLRLLWHQIPTNLIGRGSINQGPLEFNDTDDKFDSRSRNQLARFSSMQSFKQVESRSSKKNKKFEFNSSRVSPIPNGGSQWGASNISKSVNPIFGSSKKFFSASVPGSRIVSRATSPISRHHSPPRSTTPTPTLGGLTSPRIGVDDVKKTNDSLNQEIIKLRAQVENMTRKTQLQEVELERATKQLKEAIAYAGEETAKCKAAKEVIKSLTNQLKEMAEKLPAGASRNVKFPSVASFESNPCSNEDINSSIDGLNVPAASLEPDLAALNNLSLSNGSSTISIRSAGHNKLSQSDATTIRNGSRTKEGETRGEGGWVEQDEPGVYITFTSLGGVIDLKRVRFSRKRFSEKQAEQWWAENRARVYEKYNVRVTDKSAMDETICK
ncbi:hypothetical protein K1719_014853 [Acacia pycnantha]|nr:hypothetical protein K1719_014853 [Acacia pycnantha]